ncbi:hypothetical protein GALMADRAFT_211363 [Galerina marginata CBS 339.88]|uniref:MYND-type domain-containing protein n=1 Tax=Galerina marginata (strain CBS 339.88) TaxID=685588 RepID=A0A067T7S6_GALM3|nr:hypothetical protein GALMADRAFT_211363 [Galerina marginata CBS 339.88]
MADYAQIITHTPQQAIQWKELARSNPGRVARVLVLQPGVTTREGDNQGDIYPALAAVMEISKKRLQGVENKAWENLVSGGLADALCQNVCEMVVFIRTLPNMPPHLLEKLKNEARSPYCTPLEILCHAAIMFRDPPTKTDKQVIAALRKNWSEMMERIWNEPESTLRPEDSHVIERMIVAQLVSRIVVTDPSFSSILSKPSDLTVQIIARHWKYAQRPADTAFTATTLYELLDLNHGDASGSAKSKIISRILVGVESTASILKQEQAKALIVTFAEHLVRLSGSSAIDELGFLKGIILAGKNIEPEIIKTIFKATPLWNALFRLLKKSAKPTPAKDQGPGTQEDPTTDKRHRLLIILNIVTLSASVLHHASLYFPKECESLVRIWANENLFGALEETIQLSVAMPGMTMQLGWLASLTDTTVKAGPPSLSRFLGAQFPRWRLLGTLIKHDIERQQITGPPSISERDEVPPADSNVWDHGVWQCFGSLQARCMDETLCSKRGCENEVTGTFFCQCEFAKYCSKTCQTKDAKDHRHACNVMALLDNVKVSRHAASFPNRTTKPQLLVQAGSFTTATILGVFLLLMLALFLKWY